ncbi:MAG: cytochrome c biogenesis protein CcdA [Chloroflexota bacterium]|nr:cytochrome c biogenesis protein CcdA [Chloroflexota bacterium]
MTVPTFAWAIAFAAGVLSFFSPCCIPLVPGYLAYVSGVSQGGPNALAESRARVVGSALLFVLGFTFVFVLLGTAAALFGSLLGVLQGPLYRVTGAAMIALGLFMTGLLKVPMLHRELRFHSQPSRIGDHNAVLLGMAFAVGWTPCIGPVLASILLYVSATATVGAGTSLLLVYSLGLGVPFVLAALGVSGSSGWMWLKRHSQALNAVSGATLVAMGALFLTGRFFYLSILTQRLWYAMTSLGR